jgi:hypothetical protein
MDLVHPGKWKLANGQGGIRTHDTLAGIPVFEANATKGNFGPEKESGLTFSRAVVDERIQDFGTNSNPGLT